MFIHRITILLLAATVLTAAPATAFAIAPSDGATLTDRQVSASLPTSADAIAASGHQTVTDDVTPCNNSEPGFVSCTTTWNLGPIGRRQVWPITATVSVYGSDSRAAAAFAKYSPRPNDQARYRTLTDKPRRDVTFFWSTTTSPDEAVVGVRVKSALVFTRCAIPRQDNFPRVNTQAQRAIDCANALANGTVQRLATYLNTPS